MCDIVAIIFNDFVMVLSGFVTLNQFNLSSVFGPKEEAGGWRETDEAEKSPRRIHKDVGSMLNIIPD